MSREPAISAEDLKVLGWLPSEETFVNLHGDYDYLTDGYYVSQDLEDQGRPVAPTCREILDAYVTPLLLEKARLAGIAVPEFYITNSYFEPPVIVDPINPFMSGQQIVLKPGRQERAAKSMSRNYTYAICCQEIPPGSSVKSFRLVLGWCREERYRALAEAVWRTFRIPLATVRVIASPEGPPLLSAIQPMKKLKARERAHLQKVVTWPE